MSFVQRSESCSRPEVTILECSFGAVVGVESLLEMKDSRSWR